MKDGWQLGESMSFFRGMGQRSWLQQGGCGRGGTSENISSATLYALLHKKQIKKDKEGFPLRTYKLNDS